MFDDLSAMRVGVTFDMEFVELCSRSTEFEGAMLLELQGIVMLNTYCWCSDTYLDP